MRTMLISLIFALSAATAVADDSRFATGPVFARFGPVADVETTMPIPAGATFRHSFDISEPAPPDQVNRGLESAARFLNMLAKAGVPEKNIDVAMIVHGKAVHDVATKDSASAELVTALIEKGVRIVVCGQSASFYGVRTSDLSPGVEMALSAMTAHALLQQQGYTLNPF